MNAIIISVFLALRLVCGFSMEPVMHAMGQDYPVIEEEAVVEWVPPEEDIIYISRTIWGEARGCCQLEREAVAWCILNRVDSPKFPDTIEKVVTAKYQFQGYSPNFPYENFYDEAKDVLIRHHNRERGIDPSLLYFSGNGKYNTFRDEYEMSKATLFWTAIEGDIYACSSNDKKNDA